MKIIGNTVGMGLPKPNLMQTDPTKGDYVKGKDEFLEQVNQNGGNVDLSGYVKSVNGNTPDENGNVDIPEGFASEAWVAENYQPKGNYLTKVPEGYATEQFVRDGYQPKGNYLTEHQSLEGYATEEYVDRKIEEAQLSGGNVNQGGGMSATAVALLITILRNGVYITDQSANITALEQALASGGNDSGGSGETVTITQSGTVLTITGVSQISTVKQIDTLLALA